MPVGEPLYAEVWVDNRDVGFVRPQQRVKLKLDAFPFQKYGMVEGVVKSLSADATEPANGNGGAGAGNPPRGADSGRGLTYRAVIELLGQALEVEGRQYPLAPGMQVAAEIRISERTIMEYLLSPAQKAFHEAGRER